jgi:predicted HAD superfamily phosphohydrolase YqeG
MTDIVFANQYNMKSVLVDALSNVRDHPAALLFRFLEIYLLLPILQWWLGRQSFKSVQGFSTTGK